MNPSQADLGSARLGTPFSICSKVGGKLDTSNHQKATGVSWLHLGQVSQNRNHSLSPKRAHSSPFPTWTSLSMAKVSAPWLSKEIMALIQVGSIRNQWNQEKKQSKIDPMIKTFDYNNSLFWMNYIHDWSPQPLAITCYNQRTPHHSQPSNPSRGSIDLHRPFCFETPDPQISISISCGAGPFVDLDLLSRHLENRYKYI